MARKLRLEVPGAIYHVINRGNYRGFVFRTLGARQAFEACLFQACERSGWRLHAFIVMGNHFHLAVETPQGNLVAGMQGSLSGDVLLATCERIWAETVSLLLGRLGRRPTELAAAGKSAPWKLGW